MSKPSLLERLMGSTNKKADDNKQAFEETVKKQLKGLVYDDSLVDELTPIFMKLQGAEGFDKVVELLQAKERQIETIAGGEWFKQESNPDDKQDEEEQPQENLVDSYLTEKYK